MRTPAPGDKPKWPFSEHFRGMCSGPDGIDRLPRPTRSMLKSIRGHVFPPQWHKVSVPREREKLEGKLPAEGYLGFLGFFGERVADFELCSLGECSYGKWTADAGRPYIISLLWW